MTIKTILSEERNITIPIRVTSIQRGCVFDGPGVRSTVFLKGCYLTCPWCCNPETICFDKDLYFTNNEEHCGRYRCCSSCELRGGKRSKFDCPYNVYKLTYKDYTSKELIKFLLKDISLYSLSGGGVTFSGGEPLMQSYQLIPVLKELKCNGIHIVIETSLYAPHTLFMELFDFVDFWIVDVKFQFGFIAHSKSVDYLIDFQKNMSCLQQHNKLVKYRMVYFHQAVNQIDSIVDKFKQYNVSEVELLAYHSLGSYKYAKLKKKEGAFQAPTDDDAKRLIDVLKKNKIQSYIIYA